MIPIRLSLHNFLCYREAVPPIEMEAIRMACLTGENGAGKSALLDAMTWALWGRARTNADTELMSLGASEMRVEFHFRVGEADYRVARRVKRGIATRSGGKSSPTTWLDLFALDDDGSWRSQSGDGVRDTQARIVEVLRMEYDTFINSAFLVQGRADEFTTKPPAKRKEVLADILNLTAYDDLERLARARHRERADSLRELEGQRQRLTAIVGQEAAHRAAEQAVRGEISALDANLVVRGARHRELVDELRDLDKQDQQRRTALRQIEQDTAMLARLQTWAASSAREVAECERLVAQREAIEAGVLALQTVQAQRATLDIDFNQLTTWQRQRALAERAVDAARRELQRDQRDLTTKLSEEAEQARLLPQLEQQRKILASAASEATRLAQEIAALQVDERRQHGAAEMLRGENSLLMTQMKRFKEGQQQIDRAELACPVCRRPLGPDEQSHIHDEYQREGEQLRDLFKANETRIKEFTADSAAIARRVTELGLRRDAAELNARQEARVAEQLRRAEEARDAAVALQVRLVDVVDRLSRGDFASAEQAMIAEFDEAIGRLGYAADRHEAARSQERELAVYAEQRVALPAAVARLPELREALVENQRAVAEVRERLAEVREQADLLAVGVAALPSLRLQEDALRQELEAEHRRRADLDRESGRLQAMLDACSEARAALDLLESEHRALAAEQAGYAELMDAFSKKGIQAMIIETIVPELEDEANALLDRMPGNTMRVALNTQRTSSAGSAIETLDVVIRDEVGERKYELYSGGEAFRVNFALRVALSKLLTRRAGAQLQTLIIDEGFGTQDSRGREGLIEAIHSIEADFATILVISHMSDIRDEFGTRIEVSKGPDGSSVLVR
jgi:exonuclease SbcC